MMVPPTLPLSRHTAGHAQAQHALTPPDLALMVIMPKLHGQLDDNPDQDGDDAGGAHLVHHVLCEHAEACGVVVSGLPHPMCEREPTTIKVYAGIMISARSVSWMLVHRYSTDERKKPRNRGTCKAPKKASSHAP